MLNLVYLQHVDVLYLIYVLLNFPKSKTSDKSLLPWDSISLMITFQLLRLKVSFGMEQFDLVSGLRCRTMCVVEANEIKLRSHGSCT